MATVVKPLECIVEVIGKARESKHSPGSYYYPTLFLDVSKQGDDAKVWKNLSGDEVTQLQKGDRIQLVPAGKDKHGNDRHNIVLLAPAAPPAPQAPAQQGMSVEQKRAIAAFVEDQASLLKFCRDTVIAKFGDADEEMIRCSTTTLYITASRKFNLDR